MSQESVNPKETNLLPIMEVVGLDNTLKYIQKNISNWKNHRQNIMGDRSSKIFTGDIGNNPWTLAIEHDFDELSETTIYMASPAESYVNSEYRNAQMEYRNNKETNEEIFLFFFTHPDSEFAFNEEFTLDKKGNIIRQISNSNFDVRGLSGLEEKKQRERKLPDDEKEKYIKNVYTFLDNFIKLIDTNHFKQLSKASVVLPSHRSRRGINRNPHKRF